MAPKSLCLTTAFAPVPAFLGGSCPSGCSLSAPATGGLSMVSPQYLRYAAGSEKEKGAGDRLHGGTIAQLFVFCKGGLAGVSDSGVRPPMGTDGFVLACALHQRRVWLGVRRYPARTALRRFWKQGDTPCTPGGGCAPCTLLGGRGCRLAGRGRGAYFGPAILPASWEPPRGESAGMPVQIDASGSKCAEANSEAYVRIHTDTFARAVEGEEEGERLCLR